MALTSFMSSTLAILMILSASLPLATASPIHAWRQPGKTYAHTYHPTVASTTNTTNTTTPYLSFTPYATNHCSPSENPHDPTRIPPMNLTLGACVTPSASFNSFVLYWPSDEEIDMDGCIVTIYTGEYCFLGDGGKSVGMSGLAQGAGECEIPGVDGGSVMWSCGTVA